MSETSRAFSEDEKQALAHAWSWFALHAGQRMQCINYFLIAVALLITAYVTALKDNEKAVALVVASVGVVFSFGFHRLEVRSKDLVKMGEDALRPLQKRLAELTRNDALELAIIADSRKRRTTYAVIILVLHWSAMVGFAVAAAYAGLR